MKHIHKYINDNVLVKIASLNSASVLTKIITGFLTSKAIAIFIGPEGLAIIGNLRNFLSSIQSFAILGFYNGAVKYISEFKNDVIKLSKTLSTIFYLGLVSTILTTLFCYFNAEVISNAIFYEGNNYAYIIKILAIALPFYSLNMFIYSILNGFSKYKNLIVLNIVAQILGLCITLILVYQQQLMGALISVVIAESIILLITVVSVLNRRSLFPLLKLRNINLVVIKKMSSYSIMALFSAIVLPFVILTIRTYIIDNVGVKEAGFWEAMTRISKYYLLFISSLMTLYILPRFSEINSKKEFRKEVFSFYKTIMPIFGLGLIVIYFLKSLIVPIVFSSEFQPVENLFLWQLLGDFIKVLSIVIAYQFLAKRMFWHYIITEGFFVIILYLTSVYFIDLYGVVGATIAHFATYVLHFGVILLIFSSSLFGVLPDEDEDINQENENDAI